MRGSDAVAVAVSTRQRTDQQRLEQQRREVLGALQLPASILAVVLAGCGQYALAVGRNEIRGGLLYGLALAALGLTLFAQSRTGGREAWVAVGVRPLSPRVATGAVAAVVHLVALVLVYVSSPFWLLTVGLGVLSLTLAVVVAAWPTTSLHRDVPAPLARVRAAFPITARRAEVLAVGGIVLLAGVLRFVGLEYLPGGVHGDETEFGMYVLSVLRGNGPNPFGTIFLGDPALFAYVEAPFVAVFGQTVLGLRVLAALTGTLTVLACYLFTRGLFGIRVALMASAMLAVAAVHIHFSRLGLNVPQIPLFTMVSFSLLWRGYRTGRGVWYLLAGMVAGGAVYFHFSGRLLAPMLGAFMLYLLVRSRRITWAWAQSTALVALGAMMTMAPIVVHSLGQWYRFAEHVGGRLIWNQWDRVVAQHQTSDPVAIVLTQLKVNLLAFVSRQDASEFYTYTGAPLEMGLIAPLLILGLGLVLAHLNDPRYALIAIWFWPFVILGGALTVDPPQFHRLHPALPAGLIGAALALDWLIETWSRAPSRLGRPILVGLASLLIAVAGTVDASWYFGPWARAYPWPEVTAQARTIAALGPSYQVFNVGRPFIFVAHGNTRYLAEGVNPRDLGGVGDLPAPPLARPLAVIVNPGLSHYLPLLKELYPGGTATPVERPAGKLVLTQFVVPAERAVDPWPAGQGLSVEIRPVDSERVSARGVDPAVASRLMNSRGPVADRPFRATWRGQLVAPTNGSYQVELLTDGESTLRLDGRTILTADANPGRLTSKVVGLNLTAGAHTLELAYRYERGTGTMELIWKPPGGERSIVPPSALRP